jgi:glyoxylase-like metal-dependent hydrolase (beta-lactamase superfamily II)
MLTESHPFKLGNFECIACSDGGATYALNMLFANVPTERVEEVLRDHHLPTDGVWTPYTCLFINTGEHRVLVDTGAGSLIPSAGMLRGNLKAAGIEPEEIDTIIITHAHPDHIGGNVDADGQSLYANARYFISRDEWEFWTSESAVEKGKMSESALTYIRTNLQGIQDQVNLVEGELAIVPGIQIIATPGHTPGHIALSISSGGEQLLHISDVVLYPLHLEYPDWTPVFDILPEQAAASKRRIFDQAAATNALVFAHHFPPFPNLGHVTKQAVGWQWQPMNISQ